MSEKVWAISFSLKVLRYNALMKKFCDCIGRILDCFFKYSRSHPSNPFNLICVTLLRPTSARSYLAICGTASSIPDYLELYMLC